MGYPVSADDDLDANLLNAVAVQAYGTTVAMGDSAYANVTLTESLDTDSAYDGTTFTVPADKGGRYFIIFTTIGQTYSGSVPSDNRITCSFNSTDDTTEPTRWNTNNETGCTYLRIKALAAGDTVVPRAYSNENTAAMSYVKFAIYRIG